MNILLSLIFLGLSMTVSAGDSTSLTVNSSQNSFVVKLAANPTTGYQWKVVQFDTDLLTLSNSQYQLPQTKLIGAGGNMLFTFTLNKGKNYPQQTNILFRYARPWEPNSGNVTNVTIHFVTTADAN